MTAEVRQSAFEYWEVERESCGQTFHPYYVLVLKNKKKTGKTVVKASSSDAQAVRTLMADLQKDLQELSNDEFVAKYDLGAAA